MVTNGNITLDLPLSPLPHCLSTYLFWLGRHGCLFDVPFSKLAPAPYFRNVDKAIAQWGLWLAGGFPLETDTRGTGKL